MLKLTYDMKCGWKDAFITETGLSLDITYFCDPRNYEPGAAILTEDEFFCRYQGNINLMFQEYGMMRDIIKQDDINRVAVQYFAFNLQRYNKTTFMPTVYEIYNVRLEQFNNDGSVDGIMDIVGYA